MAKVKVPQAPELLTTKYQTLRGVDFSCSPVEVSREHSPDMINMISDKGGNPIKRVGWRVIKKLDTEIKDLHSSMDSMYIATDKNVYKYPSYEKVFDSKNLNRTIDKITLFSFDGKLGFTGKSGDEYFWKVGKEIGEEDDDTIPEMIISRKPDGTGGTFHNSINLLTPYRTISFLGDSSSTEYHLFPKKDEQTDAYKYVKVTKVEVMDSNGVFQPTTAYKAPASVSVQGYNRDGQLETFSVHAPYITFNSAHAPVVTGQDNIRITYMAFDNTKVNANFDKDVNGKPKGTYNEHFRAMCMSGVIKNYGYQNNDRVFVLADNNRIYFSETDDPNYIPDDNYIAVTNASKVVGLHRYDRFLVVITEDNEDESAIYFVHGTEVYDGKEREIKFALETTAVGTGALNYGSFDSLIDEPLFLSNNGIYGISNHYATTRTAIRSRSMFLDKKLLEEPNLKDSVAISWDKYYILAVNNKCYVLDGRQTSRDRKNNTDFSYEGYYWENVPVKTWGVYDDELYFGNFKGELCKFNTDVDNATAYQDGGTLDGINIVGGEPIMCRWSTPLDYEGYMNMFKTLNKKGNTIVVKPYQRTSADIYFSVDGRKREFYKTINMDMQSFTYVDFSPFTFLTGDIARNMYIRKKIKKYKALQIILENKEPYEPFGIIALVKTFSVGNYAK